MLVHCRVIVHICMVHLLVHIYEHGWRGTCLLLMAGIFHFIQIKTDLPSPPEARISSVKETNKNSVADMSVARNHKIEYTPNIMPLVQDSLFLTQSWASVYDVPLWHSKHDYVPVNSKTAHPAPGNRQALDSC